MDYGTLLVAAFISTLANVIGPILAPIIQAYFIEYFIREKETQTLPVTDDRSTTINTQPQIGTSNGIQMVSDERVRMDLKEIIGKLGPWGDKNEGNPFDHHYGYDGIKIIKLGWDSEMIVSLQVQYKKGRELVWTEQVGGYDNTNVAEVEIELEDGEYITKIKGYYESSYGIGMIKSLTFLTDKGKEIGPYGTDSGTLFHTGTGNARIVGFHGRARKFLSSFGVYVSPFQLD